jgi:hypothetical protein
MIGTLPNSDIVHERAFGSGWAGAGDEQWRMDRGSPNG